MTLKLLRTCDMLDFNSSIANFCPENRKKKCHCFSLKIDKKMDRKRELDEERNAKNFKRNKI